MWFWDLPGISDRTQIQFFLDAWNGIVKFIGSFVNGFVNYFFPVFLALSASMIIAAIAWRVIRSMAVGK